MRDLLPAEYLQMLLDTFVYECVMCGERSATSEAPASVLVRRDGLLTAAGLAHTACSPSRVREVAPGTLQARQDLDMTAQAIVIPGLDGNRPAIVCEVPGVRARVVDGDDLLIPGLRRLGLHPVARIAATPPVLADWRVRLPDEVRAEISAPGVGGFYSGPLFQHAQWHTVVTGSLGVVVLLVGVGLELQADREPGALLKALHQAARRGDLVGGTVPVTG
ncbi:hypothetical protein GCM10009603_36850 [Nocardiopsis exhalans]